MADQVKLTYLDRDISSTISTNINVQAVRGWYDFDDVEIFPGIQNRYLSGAVDEQISGVRRVLTVDFGVVSSFANRKAILYFLLDPARQLNLVMSAPTGLAVNSAVGGSLSDGVTYYYRVTAVDNVGETTGATEANRTVGVPDLKNALTWNAVSGAVKYRIYRTEVSGDYAGSHFLAESSTNAYTDDGTIALTSTYVLPSLQALTVGLGNPTGYSNSWLDEVELGRRFVINLLDRTLRTALIP
jgi:hypothetical protein